MTAISGVVSVLSGNGNGNGNGNGQTNGNGQANANGQTGENGQASGGDQTYGAQTETNGADQSGASAEQAGAPAAATGNSGGATAESAFSANQADDGTGAKAVAVSSEASDPVAEIEGTVAKAMEAAAADETADWRLESLRKALATLTDVAQGMRDDRIDSLFRKVEPARNDVEAAGRKDRFESFGADHQAAQARAVTGYAAAVSVVRVSTDPSTVAAEQKIAASKGADSRA